MKKYTKAFSITPHNTNALDPRPDAYYIGNGNFTDGHTEWGSPPIHLRGGVGMTTLNDLVIGWAHAGGGRTSLGLDNQSGLDHVGGTAETNFIDYPHWSSANAYGLINDDAGFNIGTGEFEMMAVVRFEDNGNQYQHIATRDKGASNWGWLRRSDAAGANPGKITFSMSGSDPVSATTVAYNTWYILGVSRDSSNNVQLWRDGATDGSSVSNSADLDADDDDNFVLGAMFNGTNYVQSLQGDMIEFILWESALSSSDRAEYVQRLQDRYFNDRKAKIVTCSDPDDGDTYIIEYPKVGTVIEESPLHIRDSGKYAEDIVGLQK